MNMTKLIQHDKLVQLSLFLCFVSIFACKLQTSKNQTREEYLESINEVYKKPTIRIEGQDTIYSYEPKLLVNSQIAVFNEMPDMDNKMHSYQSLLGKTKLLYFWFTTCPPCIESKPCLNHIQQKFANKNIEFISFCRNSKSLIYESLNDKPFNFKILPDSDKLIDSVFNYSFGYPLLLIVDKQNTIKDVVRFPCFVSDAEWERKLGDKEFD